MRRVAVKVVGLVCGLVHMLKRIGGVQPNLVRLRRRSRPSSLWVWRCGGYAKRARDKSERGHWREVVPRSVEVGLVIPPRFLPFW